MKRGRFFWSLICACMAFSASAENQHLPGIPAVRGWRGKASVNEQDVICSPELTETSIRYGNKTLSLLPNGRINCVTSEYGIIFSASAYFHLVKDGVADWKWKDDNFLPDRSKFHREGNRYIWEIWYGNKEVEPFKGITQSLEVLEDGRISVSFRFDMPKKTPKMDFRPWTLPIMLPSSVWLGGTMKANGRTRNMDKDFKTQKSAGKSPETEWVFNDHQPSKTFTVQILKKECPGMSITYRPGAKDFQIGFGKPSGKNRFSKFYLDLRRGVAAKAKGEIRGGVDFMAQENMLLPDLSHKNLIDNPSFERGWEGWNSPSIHFDGLVWNRVKDGLKPFELDDQIAYEGRRSLRMNTREGSPWAFSNPNIGPLKIVLEPGFYTLSFYARGQAGKKQMIVAAIPDFHKVEKKYYRSWNFTVDSAKWKRYECTFEVKTGAPLQYIGFHARFPRGKNTGTVWLDAVQLEKGKQATAYQPPPAEGGLITSSPDNFFSSKEKINGRLRIVTAKPEMSGTVRIRVKNFFGETLLDTREPFRTGLNRTDEVELPLDSLPGLGLFIVRADYLLNDGTRAYDFRRYAKIEYQTDPARKIRTFFGIDYSDTSRSWKFHDMLTRWQRLGVGAKHHVNTRKKEIWDVYPKYGIKTYIGTMLTYMRGKSGDPRIKHFFIRDSEERVHSLTDLKDPKILVGDFHLEAGGKITPEYLAKLKKAAKTMAEHYPHVKLWALGGELTCKMPNEWWAPNATDQNVSRYIALLLKAFAEGVREGNPEAKVYQDDPANMSPRGGIAETDRVLGECNKLGVKFDIIAIHPYRFSPEDPDTDADAAEFFKVLDKHGYGKTPVFWPEGMHWGPFDIPQWGTKSSSWHSNPVTWNGTISYDLGWTERKSAAWYARAWLVALKYSDRLFGATSGQTNNNCYMDLMLTPYAAQLIPNTLCSLFEGVKFKKDIRFAPYIRVYVFEDAQKRPLAAVWCHQPEVDSGAKDAPGVTVDFGDSLESVTDLMNSPRAFQPGKMKFTVSPFPLFFRGKTGTLKQMIAAFETAEMNSDSSIIPLEVAVNPVAKDQLGVTVRNSISKPFNGTFRNQPVRIPAAGKYFCKLPLDPPLKTTGISLVKQSVRLVSDRGVKYNVDCSFEAFAAKRVSDQATVDSLDWNSLPAIPITRKTRPTCPISGTFRMGWNRFGLFLEAVVRDPKFVHVEYPRTIDRWKNDCLQIYFDTFANARQRKFSGYDEDDYDYAVFPNSKGTSAQVFRYQTVESQLGLATQAPPDKTFAPDIPCRFTNKDGVLTYRVFFPAKYLLPMKMQKNWAFGFGLFIPDSAQPDSITGALSLARDGQGCCRRPHTWPTVILTE